MTQTAGLLEPAGRLASALAPAPEWLETASNTLARRLDSRSSRPIAVAFSGGGDSLALLLIAKAWADRVGRRLVALTVDHGLSPQSAQWTARAGETARCLGVDWRGLSWSGEKPLTGLPSAARDARHALLAVAARDAGASVIPLGHTADDRLESGLIRIETPGHGRLREWSPSPAWPEGRGLFLLRPLLLARRSELRAHLTSLGLSWLDDPGNADPRFARSRARTALSQVGAPGRPPADEGRIFDGEPDHAALARRFAATPDGRLQAPRNDLAAAAQTMARALISAAILSAAGMTRPPRGDRLDRLMERLAADDAFTVGLSGARIVADAASVTFAREAGEQARGGLAPVGLEPGRAVAFDGRFEIETHAPNLTVAALAGRAGRLSKSDAERLRALPPYARLSLPVIIDAEGAATLPAPFGGGPAVARSMVGARFAAAAGLCTREDDLSP